MSRTQILAGALFGLLSTEACTTATAQPASTATANVEWSLDESAPCLTVIRDWSASLDETAVQLLIPRVIASVRKQAIDGHIGCLELYRFAAGRRYVSVEPITRLVWGRLVTRPVDTDRVKTDTKHSLAARLGIQQAVAMEADKQLQESRALESEYEKQLNTLSAQHAARIDKELAKANDYLLEPPRGDAPCTPFRVLAKRIAEEDRPFVAVLTDGWVDCRDVIDIEKQMSGKLIMILLPRNGDPPRDEDRVFDERQAQLRVLFPNARIVQSHILERSLADMFDQKQGKASVKVPQ